MCSYRAQLDRIEAKLNKVLGQELSIGNKENKIMALVSIEQTDLDTIASEVSTVADDLAAVIAAGNLAPADETALNAAVAKLQALDVTPAPPTP